MDTALTEVSEGLDAALSESGLTQADFAAALGTSASRYSAYRAGRTMPSAAFYLRALRLARALAAARERGWMTPQTTASEVRNALRDGDQIWALKMALQARDHLRELLRTEDAAGNAWLGAPPGVGDPRWDSLLAALTAHSYAEFNREPPSWTTSANRRLDQSSEWVMPSLLLSDDEVQAATPDWLSTYGIYAAERDLVTA